jgi:arylsulfatase A-like enzyme
VTFSAIDKIGHMWGGGAVDTLATYNWDPNDFLQNTIHMPWVAENADKQLGKLIAKLKEKGQLNDTLIIVTADHGSTYGAAPDGFKGVNALNAGNNLNWYAGAWHAGSSTESTSTGSPALAPLMATGNVEFSYQSTAIETWLKDRTGAKKREAAAVMATLPGVIATYIKNGDRYRLDSSSTSMTPQERLWWAATGQQLVDSMCFSGSAEVVGLLADKTSYGAFGDHGGAQKDVQQIPMAFYMPGMKHAVDKSAFRLVDIMPTVLKTMGMKVTEPMDGSAYTLKLPK